MHAKKQISQFLFFALLVALVMPSCSWLPSFFGSESEQKIKETKESGASIAVPISQLEEGTKDSLANIEIVWQAPRKPVDAFIIRYGVSADSLTEERKVPASALQKYEEAGLGSVYRYVLRDVPPGKKIYVTVSTAQGGTVSKPSEVFEVSPDPSLLK